MVYTQAIFEILSQHARGHKTSCRCMKKVEKVLHAVQEQGIRIAADVASEYDRLSIHDFLVSDCILGKLNALGKKKPRPNNFANQVDHAIARIEQKLSSLEGTMKFMARSHRNKVEPRSSAPLTGRDLGTIRAFIREIDQKQRQNMKDYKATGEKHTHGFADAQGWVSRRLKEILKVD